MRRLLVSFLVVSMALAGRALAGGFQVTAQSARSMGMGLATTGVANDASAIFYNPAGLAFQSNGFVLGGMAATKSEGRYTGPSGVGEQQTDSISVLPELYGTTSWGATHLGLGIYTPFGLPMQWDDRDTFSGRHVSYLSSIRTINVNPTVAFQVGGSLGIAVGADWMHSKLQLERRRVALGFDVADAKLKSELPDSDGWGWNAGVLWRSGAWQLGASYRSPIKVDHDAQLEVTQILTGIPAVDMAVAPMIPPAPLDASVPIEFPASLNLGVAWVSVAPGGPTFSLEADRTDWSSFSQLAVSVPAAPPLGLTRSTNWDDTWAFRAGAEFGCGPLRCRVGAYKDETPQPLADVGPVLPDADRTGYTAGLGIPIGSGKWSVDIGYIYVAFDDRTTTSATTDTLAGLWETTGNELAINLRWQ